MTRLSSPAASAPQPVGGMNRPLGHVPGRCANDAERARFLVTRRIDGFSVVRRAEPPRDMREDEIARLFEGFTEERRIADAKEDWKRGTSAALNIIIWGGMLVGSLCFWALVIDWLRRVL